VEDEVWINANYMSWIALVGLLVNAWLSDQFLFFQIDFEIETVF